MPCRVASASRAGYFVGLRWHASAVTRSTGLDQAVLSATLRVQHDVVSRRQAVACGMSPDALAHRLRPGGPWRRLLPGTYIAVTGTPTVVQKDMAAQLYAGPGSVLTGRAALRGLGITYSAPGIVDVLVPQGRQRGSVAFVAVHRTTRMPEQVTVLGRRRYVSAARAVADTARGLTELHEIRAVVAGAVQKGRCPVSLLIHELGSGPVRGSALLRQVLAEVAEGIRSVAEADFMDLIKRGRLPMPLFNPGLYDADGALIAFPDAYWPEAGVAGEVDSREWHLSPADWQRTMRRHAQMSRHGIIVLHFTPREIRSDSAAVIAAITDAVKAGSSRPPLSVAVRRAS
jgi:hypothetical protein